MVEYLKEADRIFHKYENHTSNLFCFIWIYALFDANGGDFLSISLNSVEKSPPTRFAVNFLE